MTVTSTGPTSSALPRGARLADAATLVLLIVAACIILFGGFRLRAGNFVLSAMSWVRPLVLAMLVAGVRHAVVRRDPIHRRVRRGLVSAWEAEDVRAVLPLWLFSRGAVLAVGFFAVATIGFQEGGRPFRIYENDLLNLPARFDTGWYLTIAREGYSFSRDPQRQQNIAFMPGLPMLMRIGGQMIGGHPLIAGQLIVLVACLWGFVYLYRLARELLGDADQATMAVALVASYPFAVFLGAVYTESLFLLSATGAFYHARRGEPWPTFAFALLAGVSRPNGFLLSIPVGLVVLTPALLPTWAAWRTWTARGVADAIRHTWPMLLAAAGAVLGVALFSAYIYTLTGNPLAWMEAHAAWGRRFTGVFDFILGPYYELDRRGVYGFLRSLPIDLWNGAAAFVALGATVPVTRRYGLGYGAFIVLNLLPPLMMGGWLSVGRVTLGLFPMFLWLAAVIPARQRAGWLIASAALQGLAATLFYTWRQFL